MNNWSFDISKLEKFLERYEIDFKKIFSSLKNEDLISLIDLYDIKSLKIKNDNKENYLKSILSNQKGVFLLVGGVADENVNYFRFLDGIQYRINSGEVYEYSAENFHNYSCNEEKVSFGKINLFIEVPIGLTLEVKENKVILNIAVIEENYINKIKDIGDLKEIVEKYLKEVLL